MEIIKPYFWYGLCFGVVGSQFYCAFQEIRNINDRKEIILITKCALLTTVPIIISLSDKIILGRHTVNNLTYIYTGTIFITNESIRLLYKGIINRHFINALYNNKFIHISAIIVAVMVINKL